MEQETRTARDAGAPVKIGAEAVRAAAEVLRRYRAGKQNLDRRIIDNEQFWKLRHWEQMEKAGEGGDPEDIRPASGWLVNASSASTRTPWTAIRSRRCCPGSRETGRRQRR